LTALIAVLLVTGAVLLVVEAHVTSFGLLGVAGLTALGAGVVLAVGEAGGGAVLAAALLAPIVLVLGALLTVAGRKSLQVHRRRPRGGGRGLIGRVGVVRSSVAPRGHVLVDGELWRACQSPTEDGAPALTEGESVVVEQVRGLTVWVRRADEWELLP
jgi:membrane-bound serine protease (ClpP class)